MDDESSASKAAVLRAAQRHLAKSLLDLWLGYVSVGGDEPLRVLQSWIWGAVEPPDRDYDFMAQALNDWFVELGLDHVVGYSDAFG